MDLGLGVTVTVALLKGPGSESAAPGGPGVRAPGPNFAGGVHSGRGCHAGHRDGDTASGTVRSGGAKLPLEAAAEATGPRAATGSGPT